MLPASVTRNFKIAGRASEVESLFSKVKGFLHSTNLSKFLSKALLIPESSSSRNFEKFPDNWSCKVTVCRLQGY